MSRSEEVRKSMPVSARVVSSVRVEEEARSGRRDWNVFNSCCRGREKGAAEERGERRHYDVCGVR